MFVKKDFKKIKTVYYIFDGWTDENKKKLFNGSVVFLSEEAGGLRHSPTLKDAGIFYIEGENEIQDGAQIGSKLRVAYFVDYSTPEKVEKFFSNSKIAVHRADPFEQPPKKLWQVLKGWLNKS
jgi:hypothetical protein